MNPYTALGGVARTHDSNGNLTDDGTNTYHYDFKNRLTEVKLKATSASIVTYRYDALGRRVEKAVVAGHVTTRYVPDGQQVIEEFDGAGNWAASYVYEDGIDQPRCMDRADVADVDGDLGGVGARAHGGTLRDAKRGARDCKGRDCRLLQEGPRRV
jgi:YD repeat-containing protein